MMGSIIYGKEDNSGFGGCVKLSVHKDNHI